MTSEVIQKKSFNNFGIGERQRFAYPIIGACIGGIIVMSYIWSQFYPYLMETYHLSANTAVVLGATWLGISNMVIGPIIGGYLADKGGPKIGYGIAGLSILVGFLLLRSMVGIPEWEQAKIFYYAGSFFVGLAGGLYAGTAPAVTTKWNPDRIGKAVGICNIGPGLANLWLAWFVALMIPRMGIANTYTWLGIIGAVVFWFVGALLWKNPPKNYIPAGCDQEAIIKKRANADKEPLNIPELLKDYKFWLIWLIIFSKCFAGSVFSMNQSLIYIDGLSAKGGMDILEVRNVIIPSVMSVAAIFNALGRPLWGWIMDKIGNPFNTMLVLFSCQILAFWLLFLGFTTVATLFITVILFTITNAGSACVNVAISPYVFGAKMAGKVMAVMFTATGLAYIIGPYLAAYISDLTGGFGSVIAGTSGFIVICIILTLVVKRIAKKRMATTEAGNEALN